MDKPKLNYRFHNSNATDDELTRVLLRICIEANMKKAEQAIRECAVSDSQTYRVMKVNGEAKIAELGERTLFKMPKGRYYGKSYFIPNEYIRQEKYGFIFELPQGYEIEFTEKDGDRLSIDEFVKEVVPKTAKDYESPYKRPSEVAAESKRKKPKNFSNQSGK